jgi:tetratricopeptide (TPR) repeat protein
MDIFISYASEQRATAEEIALALRAEGHRPFFDRSELPEGDAYNARIREAIRGCDLLIFLLSPESVSDGRYTLTELRFAEEKWRSPAGHVLPVMVRSTDAAGIPAYLRAVVILRPAGNVPAEVVAAVERLSKPGWVRVVRRYAVPLVAVAVIGVGVGAWRAVESWRTCGQALRLVQEAKLHQGAGDYAAAWKGYAEGLALCPGSAEAAEGQERLAMDWLQNARVTVGRESFTQLAGRVQPALSRAALARDDRRAADALAHLGWADFLRSREGNTGLDPVRYYRQALQRDPDNAYAHAFWGHHILVTSGDAAAAKAHFDKALGTTASRPLVRGLQISALSWRRAADRDYEVVRVASDMRTNGESLPAVGGTAETLVSAIWDVYHAALVRGHDKETFLGALPSKDLLDTFLWLFPAYANSSNRYAYLFMLAQLQERNGDRTDSVANYRSLLALLAEQRSNPWGMAEAARKAIARLQSG